MLNKIEYLKYDSIYKFQCESGTIDTTWMHSLPLKESDFKPLGWRVYYYEIPLRSGILVPWMHVDSFLPVPSSTPMLQGRNPGNLLHAGSETLTHAAFQASVE